jgi:hypothetical protein
MSRRANYESLRVIQWLFLGLPILFTLYVAGGVLFSNTMRHDVMFFLTTCAGALGRPIGLCLLAFGIIHFYSLPRLNRALQRYGAVLTGTIGAPFAQPQPFSEGEKLELPLTIHTKFNWRWFIVYLPSIGAGVALLWLGAFGAFGAHNAVADNIIGFVGLCLAFGTSLGFSLRPQFNLQPRTSVTATDQYLLVSFGGTNFTVQWSEARLFSVIGKREERPMVLRYALEGNGVTAEWWMYTRPPRWFDVARLGMPYEEYDRRMREILSVVSAKTGLPLLDLR